MSQAHPYLFWGAVIYLVIGIIMAWRNISNSSDMGCDSFGELFPSSLVAIFLWLPYFAKDVIVIIIGDA